MSRIGSCMYCGQERMVEAPESATLEEVAKIATRECTCKEGEAARENEAKVLKTKDNIENLFSDFTNTRDILHCAVAPISVGSMKSLTIDTGEGVKAKMSLTGDGSIKVERLESSKIIRNA